MRRCEWAGKLKASSGAWFHPLGVRGDYGGGASGWVVSDMLWFPADLWGICLTASMEVVRYYCDLMIIELLLVTTYLHFMNTPSGR